ncbi:hypothetical protein [Achromobacter aloeverae]|uniref:hypothetical protein n=1 Tax=Achromobacter aloeverae TaxID=1750518 RepID=UPI00100DE68B|nr:hypothetical protein [Achromobacter aloeverae]
MRTVAFWQLVPIHCGKHSAIGIMWTAQSPLQERLLAILAEGAHPSAQDFPEAELMGEGEVLVTSPLFGDFVELLIAQWPDLDDPVSAIRTICAGLKRNQLRDPLIHAIDAIADSGMEDLAPFVKALDARAGDDDSPLFIRIEAVAGVVRLALQSTKYGPFAIAGVLRLIDVDDEWVKAKLCRITSVLHEHLNWTDAAESLVTLSKSQACAVEARQELGFIEMANAFRSEDIVSMKAYLAKSATWFNESARLAEDAPRARMYGVIAGALAGALTSDGAGATNISTLREDAQWVVQYNPPRAGAGWLHPPPEAELEWIPLLAPLNTSEPQAFFSLLAGAIQLFEKVRSIPIRVKGGVEYRPPQGISKIAQQGRLIGMMQTWLQSSTANVSPQGRTQLEANLVQLGAPPGKR